MIQQRLGVPLDAAGRSDYEVHANAVADRVVAGRSAVGLLDTLDRNPSPSRSQPITQAYTTVRNQMYNRLSDDGRLAVDDHTKRAWAEEEMIRDGNAFHKNNYSKGKMVQAGGEVEVIAPETGKERTLREFHMRDRDTDDELHTADDCGTACLQNLGSETRGSEDLVATYYSRWGSETYTDPTNYRGDDNRPGGSLSTTESLSGQIYIDLFEREFDASYTREEALRAWARLGRRKRRRLSKKYGINEYAAPEMGQGVTIGSERDMPGARPGGYNSHFGFALMRSGDDYISLEDYDDSDVAYYFKMYGPANKRQSFAQERDNRTALGNKTTVMVVRHAESIVGSVSQTELHTLDRSGPVTEVTKVTLADGTRVRVIQRGVRRLQVEILSGAHTGKVGYLDASSFSDT